MTRGQLALAVAASPVSVAWLTSPLWAPTYFWILLGAH